MNLGLVISTFQSHERSQTVTKCCTTLQKQTFFCIGAALRMEGGIRPRFSETGPRLITMRPIYHGHLILPTNTTTISLWQFFTATREGMGYVKTHLSCILFIMLTTTCFGHCGPFSGHKCKYVYIYIYIYIYTEREREREREKKIIHSVIIV